MTIIMEEIYELRDKSREGKGHLLARVGDKIVEIKVDKEIKDGFMVLKLVEGFEHGQIKKGDSPLDAVFKYGIIYGKYESSVKRYELNKLGLVPGRYYPRIFRPIYKTANIQSFAITSEVINEAKEEILLYPYFMPIDNKHLLSSINQLSVLKEMLLGIFQTVYPERSNFNCFGNNIKNLMVLCCIEVETHLKGILKCHELSSKKNYNTSDYVKLKQILRLEDYEVSFPFFPQIGSVKPFEGWDAKDPTTSLFWYDAYNALKHNSEMDFNRSSLKNGIYAISAVAVLIRCQYGERIPFWKEQIGGFFDTISKTEWGLEDHILPSWKPEYWESAKIKI